MYLCIMLEWIYLAIFHHYLTLSVMRLLSQFHVYWHGPAIMSPRFPTFKTSAHSLYTTTSNLKEGLQGFRLVNIKVRKYPIIHKRPRQTEKWCLNFSFFFCPLLVSQRWRIHQALTMWRIISITLPLLQWVWMWMICEE